MATGKTVIDLDCEKANCPVSLEIHGTLSKPISLTPVAPPAPPGINEPGCHVASLSPHWTFRNVKHSQWMRRSYSALTGTMIFRTGYLDLDIYNQANHVTIPCRLVGEELTNYTDSISRLPDYNKWWLCDVIDPHLFPKYNVSTWVRFDKSSGTLGINQTWYCSDRNDTKP